LFGDCTEAATLDGQHRNEQTDGSPQNPADRLDAASLCGHGLQVKARCHRSHPQER